MSEKVYIGTSAKTVETSPTFDRYTGVSITVDGQEKWTAGNTDGRVMIIENPYGSAAMAKAILTQLQTNEYQPMTITGAVHDPAIEIGDAVTSKGAYNGNYSMSKSFGHMITSNIAASADEEVNHEFPVGTNSKYATYAGLRAGTTAVNGAGLTSGSVSGAKIGENEITGGTYGNIDLNTITTSNTANGINNSLDNGDSALGHCEAWIAGTGADFGGITTNSLYVRGSLIFGDYRLYVSNNYVRAEAV